MIGVAFKFILGDRNARERKRIPQRTGSRGETIRIVLTVIFFKQ